MCDVITIGSATMDVFVECEDASVVSVATKDKKSEFMSYRYGAKLEISDFDSKVGGGGVNTAVNFANLGFSTSAIFKIGDDIYSQGIIKSFENTKVDLSNKIQDPKDTTGFSIILVSFQGDRTVLAHRGANAHIKKSEINFEAIKNSKFLYIAPLNGDSNKVLDDIVHFAKENDIYVCFNAGSTSIKKGYNYLKKILETAQIVVMNKEEAAMATNIQIRPDTKEIKYSEEPIHPDMKEMFKKLKISDYQVIVITDGGNGAYAYDGKKYYYCPVWEGPVVSTLGAGDAFASTFCGALARTDTDIGKSLMYASVNSAGVVSKFGATQGLMTFEQIEEKLRNNPNYTYKIFE
ncbi:MAG: carbohydrate kinase family protein [Candidatus Gastranaerophilaceae bacterium]|nr:carbohydrate kinase family protein [Candidatus Gastranaerophilaceae bacterium]